MRILLVEDERGIADFVERALRAQGHAVEVAADGVEGGQRAVGSDLDLVILDVMLPGRSGLEILEEIRAVKPALPVIMLTARAEVADKVAGLDAGATDYMTKPFSVEELLARVRAHLRTPVQAETTRLSVAGIELDMLRRAVTRDGSPVHLSAKEFDLLAYFMRHPGQVLSREQLLNGVWDYNHDPGTNIVEVYVGYLRRKLALPDRPVPIQTVRSAGYRLVDR
ncbi:MAG TPA: response regulator transcription factor [Solirubrobacteraceae bacterium]